MYKITEFFVKNSKFTAVITATILLLGYYAINNIKSETRPPVDFATAVILTNYPGASAMDIETKITKPIEDEIRTVSGIKDVRSVSQPGFSRIFVRADIDNVELHEISGYDLQPIPDTSVDVVYCTVVFMHIEEWDRYNYILEAARVLKPGGRIMVDNYSLATDSGWGMFDNLRNLHADFF